MSIETWRYVMIVLLGLCVIAFALFIYACYRFAMKRDSDFLPEEKEGEWISPLELPYVSAIVPWRAIRHGGGGVMIVPPMEEKRALDYVSMNGTHAIIAVDRKNHFIFYRDK